MFYPAHREAAMSAEPSQSLLLRAIISDRAVRSVSAAAPHIPINPQVSSISENATESPDPRRLRARQNFEPSAESF
jgi:hypothetical protein